MSTSGDSMNDGRIKGGMLKEWRVGSLNLKEERVLQRTLGMIDIEKRACASLMKVRVKSSRVVCNSDVTLNTLNVIYSVPGL